MDKGADQKLDFTYIEDAALGAALLYQAKNLNHRTFNVATGVPSNALNALELAGNLGAFDDGIVHPTINLTELDPTCLVRNLVIQRPREVGRVEYMLNNSFGMLGVNSAVIVKRYRG